MLPWQKVSKRLFVEALKLALELKAFHRLLETLNGLNLKLEGANDFELDVRQLLSYSTFK